MCRERELFCVIGVNEREAERPGTIYNTIVYLGPSGVLARHRKLMPTHHERLFHGIGAGDDLSVVSAAGARVGGLICWENRMPMARYRLYREGPQIWVPRPRKKRWLAGVDAAHRDRIRRLRGVGPAVHPCRRIPKGLPGAAPSRHGRVRARRGCGDRALSGDVIAGPLYGEEGVVEAECDLRRGLHAKRWFDAVGHYSREEVLGHETIELREARE